MNQTDIGILLLPLLGFYQNNNTRQNEQRTNRENGSQHEMRVSFFSFRITGKLHFIVAIHQSPLLRADTRYCFLSGRLLLIIFEFFLSFKIPPAISIVIIIRLPGKRMHAELSKARVKSPSQLKRRALMHEIKRRKVFTRQTQGVCTYERKGGIIHPLTKAQNTFF